jgi:UDPglucose 6-dehydrogenase
MQPEYEISIGICGFGFVGSAIYKYLEKLDLFNIIIYDKYKTIININNDSIDSIDSIDSFEDLLKCHIIYLCLPTLYDENAKTYNMNEINNSLELFSNYNYDGLILIKSTILPDYCEFINNKYNNLHIFHNPEFLSAKTASEDFANQKQIIIGYTSQSEKYNYIIDKFYKIIFPDVPINITNSKESALTKLACNSFYATKVQFFSELYLLCDKLELSYNNVKELMLNNGWINQMHTNVPGHDGLISFGGACLPKDISALNEYMKELSLPNEVINATINERNKMRI